MTPTKCALNCDFYAGHAAAFLEDDVIATNATDSRVVFDPLGVVLAVMPWNYPFWQYFRFAAPAFMAPEAQTKVPMVMWLGEDFRQRMGLDEACLRAFAARPASHDNLFHTTLGLLDIETKAIDPALDITATCRPPLSS